MGPMTRPDWLPRPLSLSDATPPAYASAARFAMLPGAGPGAAAGAQKATASAPAAPAASSAASTFDAGFMQAAVGELAEWPWLEVRVTTSVGAVDQESLSRMLDFIWDVLTSERAAQGLRLTYDLRQLRVPKIQVVVAIAQWGAEPSRQAMFQQRVVACSICVTSGFRFKVARVAMAAFFKVCPATCRTYVVTNLESGALVEGPEVAVFDPPPGSAAAAAATAAAAAPAAAPKAAEPDTADVSDDAGTAQLKRELAARCSDVVNHRRRSVTFHDEAPAAKNGASLRGGCLESLSCSAGLCSWLPTAKRQRGLKRSYTAELSLVETVQDLQRTIDTLTERIEQLEKTGNGK